MFIEPHHLIGETIETNSKRISAYFEDEVEEQQVLTLRAVYIVCNHCSCGCQAPRVAMHVGCNIQDAGR